MFKDAPEYSESVLNIRNALPNRWCRLWQCLNCDVGKISANNKISVENRERKEKLGVQKFPQDLYKSRRW